MTATKISRKVLGAIFATGIMSFCGVVVETAMNITFPTLMREFHINTATVQWMTTIYLLIVAIIVPLSALLKKRFVTKKLFLSANLLFTSGVLLDACAPNFGLLLVGRVLQGLGTGIALPLMFNIILESVPASKIGSMMGVGSLITAVAPAVGPTFGGLVVNSLGWRFIFIFLLPILLVSLGLGLVSIQQINPLQAVHLDWLSLCTIILAFVGLIVGFSNLSNFTWWVAGSLLLGLIGLVGLTLRSQKIAQPIINFAVFQNKRFCGHVLAFFTFNLISLGLAFILPNYIQLVNHHSAFKAGLIVLPGTAMGALLAPFAGRILDHWGARVPILGGTILSVGAVICFNLQASQLQDALIAFIYFFYMSGTGLAFGNIMTSGLQNLRIAQQADGNAILNTLQQFAGACGTSIVAAIVAQGQKSWSQSLTLGTIFGSQHALFFLLLLGLLELVVLWLAVTARLQSTSA